MPRGIAREILNRGYGNAILTLAPLLAKSGKYAEAEELVRQGFGLRVCLAAYDEGYVRNAAYAVAQEYRDRAMYDKEEAWLKGVVNDQQKRHGDRHYQTSEYQFRLAECYLSHSHAVANDKNLSAKLYALSNQEFAQGLHTLATTVGPAEGDYKSAIQARTNDLLRFGKEADAAALATAHGQRVPVTRREAPVNVGTPEPTIIQP